MDDKGDRVGERKGPLIGVMWAEDGAPGTRPRSRPLVGRMTGGSRASRKRKGCGDEEHEQEQERDMGGGEHDQGEGEDGNEREDEEQNVHSSKDEDQQDAGTKTTRSRRREEDGSKQQAAAEAAQVESKRRQQRQQHLQRRKRWRRHLGAGLRCVVGAEAGRPSTQTRRARAVVLGVAAGNGQAGPGCARARQLRMHRLRAGARAARTASRGERGDSREQGQSAVSRERERRAGARR